MTEYKVYTDKKKYIIKVDSGSFDLNHVQYVNPTIINPLKTISLKAENLKNINRIFPNPKQYGTVTPEYPQSCLRLYGTRHGSTTYCKINSTDETAIKWYSNGVDFILRGGEERLGDLKK